MKKLSSSLIAFLLMTAAAFAQDAGKTVKTGSKALAKYTADATDTGSLTEAKTAADEATTADASLTDAWLLKGNAYAATANTQATDMASAMAAAQISGDSVVDNSGLTFDAAEVQTAIESFKKAYETAEKGRDKKDAISGLQTIGGSLSTIGNAFLNDAKYTEAYQPLNMMVEIDEFYKANEEEPLFPDESSLDQQKYIIAVVAREAGDTENAIKLHKELYEKSYEEPAIYAGYSQLLMADGDEEEGLAVLTKGRELYPDNSDILFAEINYYIAKQEFDVLQEKLKQAIDREPDNIGLYNALGNVYMTLSQDTTGDVDQEQSDEYMANSIKYFEETIQRDDKNVDAIYSIGSLYFNRAVAKAQEMNGLGTSKTDQARYDELNEEINTLFGEALPYFEQAEQLDKNDRNTLIALKEIYARRNDFEKSNEYKDRLEAMDAGK